MNSSGWFLPEIQKGEIGDWSIEDDAIKREFRFFLNGGYKFSLGIVRLKQMPSEISKFFAASPRDNTALITALRALR